MHEEKRVDRIQDDETRRLRMRVADLEEASARRARIERALRLSERYFRTIIENATDLVSIMDAEGIVHYHSPSVSRILGYGEEEMLGRNALELVHPKDIEKVKVAFQRLIEEPDRAVSLEVRYRSKDGSWRVLDGAGKGIPGEDGETLVMVVCRDITERKEAEEDLRMYRLHLEELVEERTRELERANQLLRKEVERRSESEEKFRLISEQSLMGIMILQDDVLKYVNQACSDIFGYSVEEALSWGPGGFLEVVHHEDRGFVREQARRKQRGEAGQIQRYVFRVKTPSGELKWAELYSRPVSFEGRPAVLISVTDVSAHVRLEEELAESEERFRSLIEKAHDVILVIDAEGRVTFASPSLERVLGFKPEEGIGGSVLDYVAREDRAEAMEALRATLENQDVVLSRQFGVFHRDGSRREVEVTASNCLYHPSVRGIIINMRDVTDRVAAHRKLERVNHLFLSLGTDLFDNMEKIVHCCRDVLDVPFAAYCRLDGRRLSILSTAPGEEGFTVVDEAGISIAGEMVRRDLRGPWIIEDITSETHLGRDHLVASHGFRSFLACPVAGKAGAIGTLCVFDHQPRSFTHEDTELVGTLARALSVEEERLSYELGLKDFVDVASHELRHPITLMKGYAATLARFGDKLEEKERREYLGIIDEGADRLDMLIKELLDVSRIERGRFSVRRSPHRLEPIIERAVREMEEKGRGRRFETRLPLSSKPHSVDAEKILRVLVILLDNAVAHSPATFPVEVSLEEVGDMGEVAMISVLDRGVGVPEKDRELIFERFYQVEDALHHTTGGMGLGLYIAREIVEAHGGRIWCEPREGGGSAFRFTVP